MSAPASTTLVDHLASKSPSVRLPAIGEEVSQDEEWVEVELGREWRKIRLHDYEAIFSIQGLYERIVYDQLKCQSPQVVRRLLVEQLLAADVDPQSLTILDLGAGNGCVAEELRKLSVSGIVGLDIIPEAKEAAERDRPGLYDSYVVGDICETPSDAVRTLSSKSLTCLVSVAALGFGDIPPLAFSRAFNQIETGGWVAFTIKESFLLEGDPSGFATLAHSLLQDKILQLKAKKAYTHRLSTAGSALTYVAFVGQKLRNIDEARLPEIV